MAPVPPAPSAALAVPAEEVVRLSANENPYGPSPAAFTAIQGAFGEACRYPDREVDRLREEIAVQHGVGAQQVLLGAGSSEILKLAAIAFTGAGRALVVAEPTFESLAHYAEVAGASVIKVPLTQDYRHDLKRMANLPKAGLVYVCNPNNPTASLTPKGEVRAFLKALPPTTAVLVDEAYFHYVESPDYETVLPFVADHPNLVVARTFSKIHGMAGLRLGYAVGQKEMIERLKTFQAYDSLSLPVLVAARASLADPAHLERSRRLNREVRTHVLEELAGMGLRSIPSAANFFMVDLGRDVQPVRDALRARQVEVGRLFPSLPKFLRVTVGTEEQMARFLTAFRQVMA
jgi:histidinol-phosphate aminotransferase